MAFQSQVFENGQWVTKTNDLRDIINRNAATRPAREIQHAPQCGIMTRTVVQSPLAHWILSARLRSSKQNDVAFIGDHYVQISELRDGQLHNISRKCDFGSRIRNAKVIGSSPAIVQGEEYATNGFHNTHTDDNVAMTDIDSFGSPSESRSLPPQLLLLVLETGDCVFLFLRPVGDAFEFVAEQHHVESARLVRPGFHLAVDPSSRFVAQACARNVFIVHELESMDRLNDAYRRGQPLKPIISSRPRIVNGIIHTIEFLWPRPQDQNHIILLLIIVRDGVSRMVTFDWELGDDLRRVLAEEKNGHALPTQNEMPMMIIPLTVRSAFFAVSEDEVAYCADALHGSPSFEPCQIGNYPPSDDHDGIETPLWTAWSRPPRLYPYHRDKDFIYMAREDGVVIFLECDLDDILGSASKLGTFCNVSTAFASLADEYHDTQKMEWVNCETLVFGGDSGQGGVWRASPRTDITKLCRIPNWSPAVDLVTTNTSSRWDNVDGATGRVMDGRMHDGASASSTFSKPDRIYAAAGRGQNGSIVEYRHGLQANIGIDFDCGTLIKKSFMFPENALDSESGHLLLLSLPGKSALLHFDSKFRAASAEEWDEDSTAYDLSCATLLATLVDPGTMLQVTEENIVFMGPATSACLSLASLGLENAVVTDAMLWEDALVVTTHTDAGYQLHLFQLDVRDYTAKRIRTSSFVNGEVTALALWQDPGGTGLYAVALLWREKAAYLEFHSITSEVSVEPILVTDLIIAGTLANTEAFTSIAFTEDQSNIKNILVAGSRDGVLVTIDLSGFDSLPPGCATCERIGTMPVHVYPGRKPGSSFVCCDTDFILASSFRRNQGFRQKQNIWTVDAEDSSKLSPAITGVTVLPTSLSGNEANVPLLLVAGDHILLSELEPQVGPVQRHIRLGVTPLKLLYSHVLKCLVVAVNTSDDRPALKFIDPETGDDLSLPTYVDDNKKAQHAAFISGLGQQGDRILCLDEWHFRSDRSNYYYLLVSTRGNGGEKGGRVLVVSPVPEKSTAGSRGKIRFLTKYKLDRSESDAGAAIPAIAASDSKIVSSAGATLLSYELDLAAKKIVMDAHVDLGGPAWKLSILPGGIRTLALVKGDSLRVIEKTEEGAELTTTHVEDATRSAMDMLEVAGAWASPGSTPVLADPPRSIVLLSDQQCSLAGLWVPWDSPGKDCEVLFEAELPSSVRRLRLGRTLPVWSREARKEHKFGLLPASLDNAQILGMGIDGSMQSFTLLSIEAWRFLRFVQNIAETSEELYPFTYVPWEEVSHHLNGNGGSQATEFDPTPVEDRRLEMQVDGDMLLRCLEKRALEGLVKRGPSDWYDQFKHYLMGILDVPWKGSDPAAFDAQMFFSAYEVLEYYLVPII
ncbi:unnamed protein product [Discula destructiva]